MLADLYADPSTGVRSLRATSALAPGQTLCTFSAGDILHHPTRFTLQLDEDRHILLSPEPLWYTNHSCAPNVFFDTEAMEVVILTPVAPGDELRFFYPSTEWSMAEPFVCACGSPDCLGRINGAADLPDAVLERYRLTPYVARKWRERSA
jgi:hypothetical protein